MKFNINTLLFLCKNGVNYVMKTLHVKIADVIIGFELTSVTAEETVGVVTLVVSVLDGGTTTPITLTIMTQNGTATSKPCQPFSPNI